jgi:hypothetical protein
MDFPTNAQPGLFETFQGHVCSDAAGVKAIAHNFSQCVPAEDVERCMGDQISYFLSSGANPVDAAKALALVMQAYRA